MKKLHLLPLDYAAAAAMLAYAASAVVTPICLVILARELSLNLTEGGGLEAVRSGFVLLILLVSGFAAARWGKARSLGVSALFLGAGLFIYALAPNYAMVLLAMALLGLGSGVIEGLVNPLVQDLHPGDSGRYLNFTNGFWSVGVMATVLFSGELLTHQVSWRLIVAFVGAVSAAVGVLFLIFADMDGVHVPTVSMRGAVGHMAAIVRHKKFPLFALAMFFAAGVEAAYTFWSASYIQLSFAASPRAGGVGTACFAGGMVLGRFAFGHFVGQKSLKKLILFSTLAGFVVSLGLPAVDNLTGLYGVLVLAGLSIACFWPSLQSYAADHIPIDHTMLFILLSCAGIPGFGLTCWMMGRIGDMGGLRVSFLLIPVIFALLGLTILAVASPGRNKISPEEGS